MSNAITTAWQGLKSSFGRYIAAESGPRRRDPGTTIRTSDDLLTPHKKRRLQEGARELQRNYAVAAWAIRKHLDYVSTFEFQAQTGIEELDRELESLVAWWSRPANCHQSGRHSLRKITRLCEARRTVDGDIWVGKLRDGRLSAIESDRVQDPAERDSPGDNWVHGCLVNPGGAIRRIAVHRRCGYGRYEFERTLPASQVCQLGYFDAFDQVRGVSPLSSAIADFQDVLEVKDYAKAKAKITQLFALAITREMADEEGEDVAEYAVDFANGPVKLDMDPGDKAEFLESKHPSSEFQAFLKVCLQCALKALDLPWSFYDEAYTNFFGSRAALVQYQLSCRDKRADLIEFLNRLLAWRLNLFVARGTLILPTGMRVSDLSWQWVPAGVPWWDTAKEVKGDVMAVDAGLRTRSEIRRERYGDDWRKVQQKLAEEKAYMESLGLSSPMPELPAENPEEADDEA